MKLMQRLRATFSHRSQEEPAPAKPRLKCGRNPNLTLYEADYESCMTQSKKLKGNKSENGCC